MQAGVKLPAKQGERFGGLTRVRSPAGSRVWSSCQGVQRAWCGLQGGSMGGIAPVPGAKLRANPLPNQLWVERAILMQHLAAEASRLQPDRSASAHSSADRQRGAAWPEERWPVLQDFPALPPQAARGGLPFTQGHLCRQRTALVQLHAARGPSQQAAVLQALMDSILRSPMICWWGRTDATALCARPLVSTTPISTTM